MVHAKGRPKVDLRWTRSVKPSMAHPLLLRPPGRSRSAGSSAPKGLDARLRDVQARVDHHVVPLSFREPQGHPGAHDQGRAAPPGPSPPHRVAGVRTMLEVDV